MGGGLPVVRLVESMGYDEGKHDAGDEDEDEDDEALGPDREGFIAAVAWAANASRHLAQPTHAHV